MIKFDIQMFGGRGTSSSYGEEGKTLGDDQRRLKFYDLTDKYKGMSLQEFEKRIRGRKNEYIALTDENGRVIIAGTSYDKGSVAIPTTHPDFNKASTMTHNHPIEKGRELGGSFSGADVRGATTLGIKNIRATAGEKTYIFMKKGATKRQTGRLYKFGTKSDKVWDTNARARIKKIQSSLKKKGKKMTPKIANQIYYGYGTRLWKDYSKNSGYVYTEIKAKYR